MLRIFLTALILVQSSIAFADAEGEIKYRKGVYQVVRGHMAAMGSMMRDGVYMENLAFHANGMKDIATITPTVFPAGSGDGKTNALTAIWEQPGEFKAAMDKFVNAANGIASAVESRDRAKIGGAMKALGGSCKNCHDNFKAD